jgi:hypothetical protein
MNISEFADFEYWLTNNDDRKAKYYSEVLPDNDRLKEVVRMGGVKVEKKREPIGMGKDWVYFVFMKSPTFHFDEDTHKYTY